MPAQESSPYLECYSCSHQRDLEEPDWRCHCGGVFDIRGTQAFPISELARRPLNFWRYRESLGLTDDTDIPRVSLGEVMTPLLKARFRGSDITFKLEYLLPTGSYKDRGVAVCLNHLSSLGVQSISEDSSGNAGASTAAYAAAAGIEANIYVPQSTSTSKINQVQMYGAHCHLIPGSRSESARQAKISNDGSRYIGHSWNAHFACGVKSVAYEIAEQCGWKPPDWIVTPAGGGSLVMGLIDGMNELLSWGYISKLPRILVVQAEACSPIYHAWSANSQEVQAVEPGETLAEGVKLPDPARGNQVLDAIRRYKATMLAVNDTDLLSAWRDMAKIGIFIEPTSALAVAGAWRAKESKPALITPEASVVVLITGHGLKTKAELIDQVLRQDT